VSENFFSDNADLVHHIREVVPFESFVELWERGFGAQDGPTDLGEAKELYFDSLTQLGAFAAREIAPRAREIDEQGVAFVDGQVRLPPALLENIEGLKRLGFLAVNLPRERGGFNFPYSVGAAMLEVIGRACTNTLLLHAFHQSPASLIESFGTDDQRARWGESLAAGRISGSVAMTEPDAGSDLGRVATRAVASGDAWQLTGRKQFITNGCGDMSIVLARSAADSKGLDGLSLFIVPREVGGRENYTVARPEHKQVIRGSATCEIAFDDSSAELLGPEGHGFKQILAFMNEARVAVAIQGLGLSQAALVAAREYASRRVQMGRPIARHELVADMLYDMEAEVAAMRALVFKCAALKDRIVGLERSGPERHAKELRRLEREVRDRTPAAKWFGAERTLWITRTAVQVLGGYGVVCEYDVERFYRDALILPIYEGTSQIQALMSLKDQARWAFARPWPLGGPVSVAAPPDMLGDALREMSGEYNRSLRYALRHSLGLGGLLRVAVAKRMPEREDLSYALLSAERLLAMLAYTRAAEALVASSPEGSDRRKLAERFVYRSLPLVRLHGEIVRSGDESTLEAMQA